MNLPSGIYVTQSRQKFLELDGSMFRGYMDQYRVFKYCDGSDEEHIYWWRLGNIPKREVVQAYIVIGNKVRWRARILEFRPAGWVTFKDGRELFGKCWMLLFDFEQLPKPYEFRKGFQGFRYKY